jgi:hypothetical protein
MSEPLKIFGVKTNSGVLLSEKPTERYSRGTSLTNYLINGEKPESTFHIDWVTVKEKPESIEQLKSRPNINHRYELIDKSLESDKFPLVIDRKEVAYYDDDDYYWVWKKEYSHLQSLYNEIYDKQDPEMVRIEFEYEQIAEVDEVKNPDGFSYTVLADPQWSHKGTKQINHKDVEHQLLDKIMFPNILLNNKPCKFTSEQMYNIVRQYIKQHIDYDVAAITSDYRFCFTVVKKIELHNPYTLKDQVLKSNGRPYKRPKYNTRYIDSRNVEVFEMTYSPENYKGYTPISEMIGENIEDLKEKVDRYCEELIAVINKPLRNCEACEGKGVIARD